MPSRLKQLHAISPARKNTMARAVNAGRSLLTEIIPQRAPKHMGAPSASWIAFEYLWRLLSVMVPASRS